MHTSSPVSVHPAGRLVLIGGGVQTLAHMPRPVLAAVAARTERRATSTVVLVPAASKEPTAAVRAYVDAFSSMGVKDIHVLDLRRRREASNPAHASITAIRSADVVFFTGGDQARLSKKVRGTPLHAELREALGRGATLAGTSAGAVAMAEIMHFAPRGSGAESTDQVATAPGLGLFPDAYVDTHFAQRRRLPRLFSLVQTTPTRLGLGLDEDTGVVLQGQRFDVVGQGAVTVIDGRPYADDARAGMVVHVLRGGDAFDLAARTPIFSAWRRDYALWSPDDTRGRRVDRSSAWPAPRM